MRLPPAAIDTEGDMAAADACRDEIAAGGKDAAAEALGAASD